MEFGKTCDSAEEYKIDFVPLQPENPHHRDAFTALMLEYIAEMNTHSHRPLPEPYQMKWIRSILSTLGDTDRHLELCYTAGMPVGFLFGKIDREGHRGYIRPGWGYILEFYVMPAYRRRGIGKTMLHRLQSLFRKDGADKMYLTADPVTGKPFWEAMDFTDTGEISPDNQLYIYEKEIPV